ncbi:MAG: class I SAM-dependent methyltransferase [Planctomycetota bacterium]|jgi:SAM-dependent methyltransferase
MEYVKCNFCNNNDAKLLFSKKDKFGLSECDFNVVQCRNCGLIYINPRPSENEIAKFYPETYSWKETLTAESKITKTVRKLEKMYRYHLLSYETSKVIKAAKRKMGKLLDVGCGSGDRLDIFRRLGFDTYGVEISASAEYARERFGLNVKQGDLFEASYPDSFFDIITLNNVLEHTHNPQKITGELYRILKEDGIVAIQVPNIDCIQFKLFKKRWAAVDVPRDMYYFNVRLLKKILTKENFVITNVDHFNNWWHPPTIVISLFPKLDPQRAWAEEEKRGNPVLKRLLWIFWTLVLPPFTFFESLIKRGAIVTVYATKQNN